LSGWFSSAPDRGKVEDGGVKDQQAEERKGNPRGKITGGLKSSKSDYHLKGRKAEKRKDLPP